MSVPINKKILIDISPFLDNNFVPKEKFELLQSEKKQLEKDLSGWRSHPNDQKLKIAELEAEKNALSFSLKLKQESFQNDSTKENIPPETANVRIKKEPESFSGQSSKRLSIVGNGERLYDLIQIKAEPEEGFPRENTMAQSMGELRDEDIERYVQLYVNEADENGRDPYQLRLKDVINVSS